MALNTTNTVDIMNAIREDIGDSYFRDVALATSENYMQVGRAVADYTPHANAFIATLLDKIGLTLVKSANATNHLERFKKGVLPYGYTIEEIFVELAKRNVFDQAVAETEVFKRELPDVKTKFHSVNRQDFYKTTISQAQLKQAFTTENGLNLLISGIVESLIKGDRHDEYQSTKKVIVDYVDALTMKSVEVQDPLASSANMTAFIKKAREISSDMTFLSNKYNTAGVMNDTQKEKQVILVTPQLEASMDVDVLASAFNMSRVEFLANRVLIDTFGYTRTDGSTATLDGVYAMIVDTDFLMIYDTNFSSETVWNPQGLYWNYWLHHWQVMSASTFNNAVMFKAPVAVTE